MYLKRKKIQIHVVFQNTKKMTDSKTKAQDRLHKMRKSVKDTRKNPKTNLGTSPKELIEMACRKPESNLRPMFSSAKERLLKTMDIQIAKTADRLHKPLLPPKVTTEGVGQYVTSGKNLKSPMNCYDSLSDITVRSENPQQKDVLNTDVSQERLYKPRYLESSCTHPERDFKKNAHLNKSSLLSSQVGGPAQKRLRKARTQNLNRDLERYPKSPSKRRSDHDISGKAKVAKIEESKSHSVNKVIKNQSIDPSIVKKKLKSILDSYSSASDHSTTKEVTLVVPFESIKSKEPAGNNYLRKSIHCSNFPVTSEEKSVAEDKSPACERKVNKEQKFTPKTKMQDRLKKILKSKKEEEKRSNNSSMKELNETNKRTKSNSDLCESMDWEPSNDEILRCIRDEVDPSEELMEWQDINDAYISNLCESNLFIVVDTNVLIGDIHLIRQLSKATIRGFKITLVIPWQVLKELDNLKTKVDFKNVSFSARKAIHFLAETTNNDKLNVAFQTQAKHFEECNQFIVEVPDDHLIKCCHQIKNRNQKVILLSNDVNLRVKTITNNIQAVDNKWIRNFLNEEISISKLDKCWFEKIPEGFDATCIRNNSSDFIHKATISLQKFLFNALIIIYQEKYGDLWPLWIPEQHNLLKILNFMISNPWFEPYVMNLNSINDFFIKHRSYNSIKPKDVEWFGRKCVTLARSMINFIPNDIVLEFLRDLSFLKTPGSTKLTECSYIDASYRLAEKYLKDTEDSLNEFVAYLNNLNLLRNHLLKGNEEVLRHIDINLQVINHFQSSIIKFQEIEGDIPLDCEAAKTLHTAICNFVVKQSDDDVFPIFSPEDIIEYVNQNRNFFQPALIWLADLKSSLIHCQSTLM